MTKHKLTQENALFDTLHEVIQSTQAPIIAFLHDTGKIKAHNELALSYLSIGLKDVAAFKLIPEKMEPQAKPFKNSQYCFEKIKLLRMTIRLSDGKLLKTQGEAIVFKIPSGERADTLYICSLSEKYDCVHELLTTTLLELFWSPKQIDERRVASQMLDTIPGMVYWKDNKLRYKGCNASFASRHHISPFDIIGKTESDIEQDRVVASHAERVDRDVIETGQRVYNSFEPYVIHGDKVEWVRTQRIPIMGENKEVIGVLGWIEDAGKQMENNFQISKLREKSSLLESLINSAVYPLISWIETDDGIKALFVPDSISSIGVQAELLRSNERDWLDLIHVEDRQAVLLDWRKKTPKMDEFTLQFRIVDDSKNSRTLKVHVRSIRSLSGLLIRYEGAVEEVKDIKQIYP